MRKMQREFLLEGLGCANCAAKMERRIEKIQGITHVSISFATKKLIIEWDTYELEEIKQKVKEIVQKIEPHVQVIDKSKKEKPLKKRNNHDIHQDCCGEPHGHDHGHEEHGYEDCCGGTHGHEEHRHESCCGKTHGHEEHGLEGCGEEPHEHDHGHEEHEHESSGEHNHDHGELNKKQIITLTSGAILFFTAMIFKFSFVTELSLYVISYLLIGKDVLLKAIRNILRGEFLDENFLMTIAGISAFAIKEFPEAVAVMLFFRVGEFFEGVAVNRSRKSIEALLDIRPDFANLKTKKGVLKVSPEEVMIGQLIIVKPGEKIPLDGKVIEGTSMLDTSVLTGESVPRKAQVGDEVFSGAINQNGVLTVEVTKAFGESTVSKILELVEKASSKKAQTEKFITRFARYYTPSVVFVALMLAIIPPLFVEGATFTEWIYRAAIFLVVSCPCALVISIPLGFFGGIGGASKNGILIKGGNYLEVLNKVDAVVFDKTGTITKGVFKVTKINTVKDFKEEDLIYYAAYAEYYSNHPIAVSIRKIYHGEIKEEIMKDYEEISGHGVKVIVDGKVVLVGNKKLMEKYHIEHEEINEIGTIVHIAVEGKYAGAMIISDEIKEDSLEGIKKLKKLGIKKLVMLTGDHKKVAEAIAKEIGIDEVHAELLPHEKVEKLEALQKNMKENIAFIGDGINDAPVLARADIGVAMGGLGSDAAIEAADVVLMTDEISKMAAAIQVANRTRKIVWQNIIFSLGIKGIVMVLGAAGMANLWEAVFADVGVALIAIFNAMRVMNYKA
ncbi:heavy metal translocating P-type ATPase [Crassaminicella profunda]|uniref:heavy metal translocating P-type ATPase n=1 Tax=Crassaminicella profunda TaxID=1286698 RepID=UPI0031B85571